MKKIILFGGKGGVGKTTCSASYAIHCAEQGLRTLIVSTDPAHSTSDIFGIEIGDEIMTIQENLDGLEIDADYECEKYMQRVKGDLVTVLSPAIVKELDKQINAATVSPGTEEAALFDKIIEVIIDKGDDYDKIIFDTAPTGHTVRLMALPDIIGAWMETLIEKRRKSLSLMNMSANIQCKETVKIEEDPIVSILTERMNRIVGVKKILVDKDEVSFVVVTNAEKMPIKESKKAVELLEDSGIHVDDIVVNRVLPDDFEGEFWENKKKYEKIYLEDIYETFKDKKIIRLPMLKKDMGPDNVKEISKFWVDEL